MTREELAVHQEHRAKAELFALYSVCRRRFLRAADLLGVTRDRLGPITTMGGSNPVDLAPLLAPWTILCRRYRDEAYEPQIDLFVQSATQPAELWGRFIHHYLFPALVRDDEVVRNVLRAVGAVPCPSPAEASHALCLYMNELALPGAPPLWAPEEEME